MISAACSTKEGDSQKNAKNPLRSLRLPSAKAHTQSTADPVIQGFSFFLALKSHKSAFR